MISSLLPHSPNTTRDTYTDIYFRGGGIVSFLLYIIYLFVCLFIYLFMCLFIYLSIYLFPRAV